VQKLSGCVTEDELEGLGEKAKGVLWPKIKEVEVEKNLLISEERTK